MLKNLNARRASAVATLGVVLALGLGGTALAQTTPTDPLSGAGDTFFTDIKDYMTGKLIPAVIGLVLVGVAVALLIKWGKKGVKSS